MKILPIKQTLADLMRPKQLKDLVGQEELVNEGAPLYQIIHKHVPVSFLLWEPPGTGKTSLAPISLLENITIL